VARADGLEELLDLGLVAHLGDSLTTRMQVAALAQRYELLDNRTKLLRLGQSGDDLLVLDQRGGHVREHGLAVARGAVELTVRVSVAHLILPSGGVSRRACDQFGRLNSDLRSVWPDRRCSQAANSAHPYQDGDPSGREL